MAKDMGDLEKALRAMDDAAPGPETAGGEKNALIPADLGVHPNWPLVCLIVSVLVLTNHLFVGGSGQHVSKNQVLITPMLTVIVAFLVFLAAICLLFRAVIKQAA